jgi:ribonucleoside-diphosphate reductase beta chain
VHVQSYRTPLDTYIPDHAERAAVFSAVENSSFIQKKAQFCFRWIDSINELDRIETFQSKEKFLFCFPAVVLIFFIVGLL